MQRDPKTIPDGWITLIGGQDSGKSASLIRDDQASELWNMTVRGGYPTNRPGFKKIPLTFATEEIQDWFTTHVHQGSIVFKPYGQQVIQVWSVGGRIFTVDVLMDGLVNEITPRLSTSTTANFTVPAVNTSVAIQVSDASRIYPDYPIFVNGKEYQVLSISGSTLTAVNINDTPTVVVTSGTIVSYLDPNASNLTKVWMQQADRFLIIQDGFSQAIIFDGAMVRRADPARLEVPTGTVMAYGLGRLWVAINEREFVAGDIIYGPTGTPLYNYADAILHFTENTFLAEGGAFSLPFEAGKITAMDFMPVWDTSTGQGPLMVFTESSATSVDASPARETWKNITSPIQAVSMRGPGPKGSWSTVPIVNGDIFFRSPDGIRSLALAVRGWGDWGSTPLSTEMDNVLRDDDESWLFWTSAIVFDNRLLMTSGNRPGGLRPKFNGIVALDFHVLSAMAQKLPPVYDGTWTGLSIWQLFKGDYEGRERAFAAVTNVEGINELWEISKANRFDNDEGRIVSTLISRNMFNKGGFNFKRLYNCEIWVDDIVGTVDFRLYYQSDQYPCWTLWNTAQVCVNFHDCVGAVNCSGLAPQFRPGYKTRIGFGQPADGDENNDAKPIRIGYEFQILLRWEGRARVRKVRIKAMDVDEQPNPDVGVITVGCQEVEHEVIPAPFPEPEPEPDLWWDFETTGATMADLIQGVNVDTILPNSAAGIVGGGFEFVANINSSISVLTQDVTEAAYTAGQDMSLTSWFKVTAAPDNNDRYLIHTYRGKTAGLLRNKIEAEIGIFGGQTYLRISTSNGTVADDVTIQPYIFDSDWHHIVTIYEAATGLAHCYIDTILVASTTVSVPFITQPEGQVGLWQLGAANGCVMEVVMDEFGVFFDALLSAGQIGFLFNSGAGRTYPF
jgi:concanavalin A-like lectin/glucanase superfamily protein